MKIQNRSIPVCVLLTIVTCGIYSFYWFYCMASDIYGANGEESRAGMDLVLGIITCGIYFIYIYYVYGKKMDAIRQKNGMPPKDDSILFVILAIFGLSIVNDCIIQNNLNTEIAPLVNSWEEKHYN